MKYLQLPEILIVIISPKLENLPKACQQDYHKHLLSVDVLILDFIVEQLSSGKLVIPEAQINMMVELLDKYTEFASNNSDLKSSNLQRLCLEQLFKLAKHEEINIQKIVVESLLKRCKTILENFISDDNIYGGMMIKFHFTNQGKGV